VTLAQSSFNLSTPAEDIKRWLLPLLLKGAAVTMFVFWGVTTAEREGEGRLKTHSL